MFIKKNNGDRNMKRNDIVYYVGYLTLFILFGVWMLLWALDAVLFREAILLWGLSGGIILVIIGGSGVSGRGASNFQLGAGLGLTAFMLILLGVTSDVMGGIVGAAVGIIVIGIIGLLLLFRGIRKEA
jgi:hypothetical protein